MIDLHCDLLDYLIHGEGRTPLDPEARCSLPQLIAGGTKIQVLALFTTSETGCQQKFEKQLATLSALPQQFPKFCTLYSGVSVSEPPLSFIAAVENASGLCGEEEPFEMALKRLDQLLATAPCLYVSLTWNGENRFGGGTGSETGLKEEGKRLLYALAERGLAVDFSHASDRLAFDMLSFMDQQQLPLSVLASHSNFRAKCAHPRNLPDELAQEIIRRKGVIGLVYYGKFVEPPTLDGLVQQVLYGLELGGKEALVLGSDFFCINDFPQFATGFIEGATDASFLPTILTHIEKAGIPRALFQENAHRFLAQRAFNSFSAF